MAPLFHTRKDTETRVHAVASINLAHPRYEVLAMILDPDCLFVVKLERTVP
jgi:hypothetical protein